MTGALSREGACAAFHNPGADATVLARAGARMSLPLVYETWMYGAAAAGRIGLALSRAAADTGSDA